MPRRRQSSLLQQIMVLQVNYRQEFSWDKRRAKIFLETLIFSTLATSKPHKNIDFVIVKNDIFLHTFHLLRATCIFLLHGLEKNVPKFILHLVIDFTFILICTMYFMQKLSSFKTFFLLLVHITCTLRWKNESSV